MNRLQQLSRKIARLQAEFEEEKAAAIAIGLPGRHGDCTIYVVRKTYVKRHYRRAPNLRSAQGWDVCGPCS